MRARATRTTTAVERHYAGGPRLPRLSGMDVHTMSDPVVTCRGLRFSYGHAEVVSGVDLDVGRGELFALLGTNGAGKTTTMELLLGHRRPSHGTVRVLGREPGRDRRDLAADVGVVFQEGGCAPDLTVAETVRLWLRLHRRRHVALATRDLLDELQLGHRAAVRVRQLSGGERRRLDLAVALCGNPQLLVLDEPTSGLDPQSRAHTWAVLRERLRRGITVVLTTHYLEEAEAVADRVAIMNAGTIAAVGTVPQVRRTGSLAEAFHRIAAGPDGPGLPTGVAGPGRPTDAVGTERSR
jgi:ABC-2 type transport system ATP-binding protein